MFEQPSGHLSDAFGVIKGGQGRARRVVCAAVAVLLEPVEVPEPGTVQQAFAMDPPDARAQFEARVWGLTQQLLERSLAQGPCGHHGIARCATEQRFLHAP